MNYRFFISILLVGVFAVVTGCSDAPKIVVHRIQKDRSGLEKLRQSDSPGQSISAQRTATQKTRMAVAIFEEPDATWFFKVSGPAEQVASTEDQWKPFFQTVTFDGGQPSWDMPDNWSTAGSKPMRHATLIIGDSQPPLELAISSLGPEQPLLLNVNRWRGQIGLNPATEEELDQQIEKLESAAGKYLVFDAVGTGSGAMSPPFAGGNAPFANREPIAPMADNARGNESSKLAFTTPDGWTAGNTSSMVQARLIKKVESAEAQITIIEMPADINEWEPNVARWADQVGMGGLSTEEMAERISKLSIDGIEGKLVDLVDLDSDSPQGTIAGMVKRNGSAWFLKLAGDKTLVEDNRETFMEFLASLRFE